MGTMDGKVALVTGAASGIGKATATGLAREGATVVLLVRNAARGDETMRSIRSMVPAAKLETIECDLSSQASIRSAAKRMQELHPKLDVLVNCAGVFLKERSLTEDGVERTLAINHLAYFLLTNLLLDSLKRAGSARVINVSSRYGNAKVDFGDLQAERKKFTTMNVVPPTMVARVLFTQELAERTRGTGVVVNTLHPGLVKDTQLLKEIGGMWAFITNTFGGSAEKGADTALWLATAPETANVTGKMFAERKEMPTPGQPADPAARKRLWDESMKLTKMA